MENCRLMTILANSLDLDQDRHNVSKPFDTLKVFLKVNFKKKLADDKISCKITCKDLKSVSEPRPVAIGGLKTVTACTPAFDATSAYYHVMIANTA